MSGYLSAVKVEIEKFDGRINFGLWQIQVKDVLIQLGLHKALKEKISGMKDEEWEELDLRAASSIRLCLAKNVLANVQATKTVKEFWDKLEGLYQVKGISNRLLLKEQFHNLRMDHNVKISDHLSAINGIVSELEAIGVKIDDEDKALKLIYIVSSFFL
ncbi:Retrovirus-related Pol polyprotein [Arachis hypogaea]|nr:Retrovirus-related Pol polyprotein [Arachis hypogaea]